MLFVAALTFVGCSDDDTVAPEPLLPLDGLYGNYTFGGEQIPVNSYTVSDDGWFLVMLSPLESTAQATTYAVIGVHPELLGHDVDVEYAYNNADYVFALEDPTYYHAPFRRLQSGTIRVDVQGATVSVMADVTTFDGKHFSYRNDNLPVE